MMEFFSEVFNYRCYFSIHYSQIEDKVESEKHVKVRVFTVQTNPTLGVSLNMGMGCHVTTVLDVPDILLI